jgi:hypothetical protein
LIAIAWEPWRQTRGRPSVDLSDEVEGRSVSRLYIFLIPAFVAFGPLAALLVNYRRSDQPPTMNLWLHSHQFWPSWVLLVGGAVAFQLFMRAQFLRAARRWREERARSHEILSNAGRRS